MKHNPIKVQIRLCLLGAITAVLGMAVWGSLGVTAGKAKSIPAETVQRRQWLTQIGVLACPTNPSISFSPTNPDAGEEVEFDATITGPAGGGVVTVTWNFGDGSVEEIGQQQIPHTYSFDGVYTVIMTADGESCASPPVATRNITVGTGVAPATILYFPLMFKNYPPVIFPTGAGTLEAEKQAPPHQVTGLDGDTTQNRSTTLRWHPNSPDDAVTGYHIYRRKQAEGESYKLWRVVPGEIKTYVDPAAGCGYAYYVTALNESGESPGSMATYFSPACGYSNASGMAAPYPSDF